MHSRPEHMPSFDWLAYRVETLDGGYSGIVWPDFKEFMTRWFALNIQDIGVELKQLVD